MTPWLAKAKDGNNLVKQVENKTNEFSLPKLQATLTSAEAATKAANAMGCIHAVMAALVDSKKSADKVALRKAMRGVQAEIKSYGLMPADIINEGVQAAYRSALAMKG